IENSRMIAGDGVNIAAHRRLLLGPERVVPAAALDPFARRGGLYSRGDALLHLIERFGSDKVYVQLFKSAGTKMHMSIVETRHNEVAAQIDDLGLGAFKLLDLFIGTDGQDLAAGNRQRLDARLRNFRLEWRRHSIFRDGGYIWSGEDVS